MLSDLDSSKSLESQRPSGMQLMINHAHHTFDYMISANIVSSYNFYNSFEMVQPYS